MKYLGLERVEYRYNYGIQCHAEGERRWGRSAYGAPCSAELFLVFAKYSFKSARKRLEMSFESRGR